MVASLLLSFAPESVRCRALSRPQTISVRATRGHRSSGYWRSCASSQRIWHPPPFACCTHKLPRTLRSKCTEGTLARVPLDGQGKAFFFTFLSVALPLENRRSANQCPECLGV